MNARRDRAPHPPMVVTNRGDGNWRGQGKRYPLKERQRIQGGGYGKQYGTSDERRGHQTYRTDRTQPQSHNTADRSQDKAIISQLKVLGMSKVEMGEVKIEMIKRSTKMLGLTMKMIAMKKVIQKIPMSLR